MPIVRCGLTQGSELSTNPYQSPGAQTAEKDAGVSTESTADDVVTNIPVSLQKYLIGAGLLIVGALVGVAAYFGTPPQQYKWTFFLSWGILITGSFSAVSAYLIWPSKFALRIDQHGVHEQFVIGSKSILWVDIVSMSVFSTANGESIGFRLRSRSAASIFTFGKYDVWLGNSYRIDNSQLLQILKDRQQSVARSG